MSILTHADAQAHMHTRTHAHAPHTHVRKHAHAHKHTHATSHVPGGGPAGRDGGCALLGVGAGVRAKAK